MVNAGGADKPLKPGVTVKIGFISTWFKLLVPIPVYLKSCRSHPPAGEAGSAPEKQVTSAPGSQVRAIPSPPIELLSSPKHLCKTEG